jgi:hypothetical protein
MNGNTYGNKNGEINRLELNLSDKPWPMVRIPLNFSSLINRKGRYQKCLAQYLAQLFNHSLGM